MICIDYLTKILVGLVASVYLFGVLWFPSSTYTLFYVICVLGLLFRFCFTISAALSFWKIAVTMSFYLAVIGDQLNNLQEGNGFIDFFVGAFSNIVVVILLVVIFSDLLRYGYLKWEFKST